MTKDRYFRPSRAYVLNTTIPVSVKIWHWRKGKGLEVTLKDGRKVRSDYARLPEFLRAVKEQREHAFEVSACHLCHQPCESPTRIVCENCEFEQMHNLKHAKEKFDKPLDQNDLLPAADYCSSCSMLRSQCECWDAVNQR